VGRKNLVSLFFSVKFVKNDLWDDTLTHKAQIEGFAKNVTLDVGDGVAVR